MKNDQSFKVVYSDQARKDLKSMSQEARNLGKHDLFLVGLMAIENRLIHDPDVFGEPLFTLQYMRLNMRQGVIAPVAVLYGVHHEQPVVFVKEFKLLD